MTQTIEVLIAAVLIIGGLFGLVGSFGLLKLRVPMQRLHAPTKATTLGVGCVLVASALYVLWTTGQVTWQETLVAFFLFLTAPLTALYMAKAHLLTLPASDLPPTGTTRGWSQIDNPEDVEPKAETP